MLEILKVEEKATTTGKKLKKCMIEQEGKQFPYKNVTVWENHPDYSKIVPGAKISGSYIDVKDSGQPNPHAPGKNYNNYTLKEGTAPQKSTNTDSKINAIYDLVKQIGIKVGISVSEDHRGGVEYPDADINPDDIPFS